MMNNGRPLGGRKMVRVMVALTVLAWATQTLMHQWGYGAEIATTGSGEQFVPPGAQANPASLELRPQATVVGEEVRLKQICRWSGADAATFDPIGDLILFRLPADHPYRSWTMDELKGVLRDAGVNLAMIQFRGSMSCMVSRADVQVDEGDALQQWIASHEPAKPSAAAKSAAADSAAPTTRPAAATASADLSAPGTDENLTLRQLLVKDLAQRLGLDPASVQMRFSPADEKTLNLARPQFQFDIEPLSVRNLGDVRWRVTIYAGGASQKATIAAQAFAWRDQVVLMRPLAFKQIIRPEDVVERRTLVNQLRDEPLLTMDQVVGQQAAMQMSPGTIFTARMVQAVPLVRSGQLVTVILSQGRVQVKTVARAMENGAYGQTIRLRNERTQDVYEAVVTGQQTARLGGLNDLAGGDAVTLGADRGTGHWRRDGGRADSRANLP